MDKTKKIVIDGKEIYADSETIKHINKTKNEPATASKEGAAVRISIVMEGDLLRELKDLAKQRKTPYQTLMKSFLNEKLLESKSEGFKPEIREYRREYNKDMKLCIVS